MNTARARPRARWGSLGAFGLGPAAPPTTWRRGPITRRLVDLVRSLRGERVTLGEVVDELGPEGFGLALLILALPALFPIPGPVGMTFGSLILVLSLQLLTGARSLWLPGFLRRRTLPSDTLRDVIRRSLPWLGRAERWLDECRLASLAGERLRPFLALPILLCAIAIVLPIPLGNFAPALALIVFALALMAQDGLAVLMALVLSGLALAWTVVLFVAGASILAWAANLAGL